ncbi:MAG: CRISPR-associated endonuclease Cas1 [Planctomycetota bacterium]
MSAPPVQRRIRQFNALSDQATCLQLARRLALARVESQVRYLLRATRGATRTGSQQSAITEMRRACRQIGNPDSADSTDSIRGHESAAGQLYFSVLPSLLRETVPDTLRPGGRSRRPPADRFNALLSFGYAPLHARVMQAILAVGLEPALGFFHTPRSAAHPLALDLLELFRVAAWTSRSSAPSTAAIGTPTQTSRSPAPRYGSARPAAARPIQLFERRLEEQWRHPVMKYSLSWARTIELEVRLLEKEWTGSPGLFARARIR